MPPSIFVGEHEVYAPKHATWIHEHLRVFGKLLQTDTSVRLLLGLLEISLSAREYLNPAHNDVNIPSNAFAFKIAPIALCRNSV